MYYVKQVSLLLYYIAGVRVCMYEVFSTVFYVSTVLSSEADQRDCKLYVYTME